MTRVEKQSYKNAKTKKNIKFPLTMASLFLAYFNVHNLVFAICFCLFMWQVILIWVNFAAEETRYKLTFYVTAMKISAEIETF